MSESFIFKICFCSRNDLCEASLYAVQPYNSSAPEPALASSRPAVPESAGRTNRGQTPVVSQNASNVSAKLAFTSKEGL